MTDTRKITVLAFFKAEAVAELTKLAKKANRYGSGAITFTVGETRTEQRPFKDWDGETRERRVQVCDIEIAGSRARVGNFELLAVLEHTDAGNILRVLPGRETEVDPRFRTVSTYCEHCKVRRARKDTYVVVNRDTGVQLQVGRNCLKDYTGIDPAAAIAKFQFDLSTDDRDEDGWGGYGGFGFSQTLEFILSATATSIRIDGWLSRTEAQKRSEGGQDVIATAAKIGALWAFRPSRQQREDAKRLREKALPEDDDLAQRVIAWVRSEELAANSDYIHNLKVVCAQDVILNQRHIGIACSAVAAYNRAQEIITRRRAELQRQSGSAHVGAKGDRLRDVKATLLSSRALGENNYGQWSVLYKFLTIDGNILTWITSAEVEIAAGRAVILTGTVKDHREWNGIAETRLSRAKVTEVEDGNHRVGEAA